MAVGRPARSRCIAPPVRAGIENIQDNCCRYRNNYCREYCCLKLLYLRNLKLNPGRIADKQSLNLKYSCRPLQGFRRWYLKLQLCDRDLTSHSLKYLSGCNSKMWSRHSG